MPQDENGKITMLPANNRARRLEQAKALELSGGDGPAVRPKIVHRHVQTGDWVLMNRQPTLHKASIMAHQVRVLRTERTIRMHYANCKTYNADFDGDEMNLHVPQSEFGRAEAMVIATNNQQYIGLAGEPLRGLIQDHIVAGTLMTCRDAFFNRDHYQALVYACLPDRYDGRPILTVPPAILKPRKLWTGKQIITTLLKNLVRDLAVDHFITARDTVNIAGLNLRTKSKIRNSWTAAEAGLEGEETVLFRNGHMLMGLLDKSQCGASANGLVHACFEVRTAFVG